MSWLNFNDSLNSLKGQISNLAQTVLAEDESSDNKDGNYEELRNLCIQQKLEIENLKKVNEELRQNKSEPSQNENWNWVINGENNTGKEAEDVSSLKREISNLKSENRDLLHQLEQLDAENQQNCAKIIQLKDTLQGDFNRLQEQHENLLKEHERCRSKEEGLKRRIQEEIEEYKSKAIINNDFKKKYCDILEKYNELICNNKNINNETVPHVADELFQLYQKQIKTFEEDFKNLNAQEQNAEIMTKFKNSINELNEKLISMQAFNGNLSKTELGDRTSKLETLNEEINALKKENERLILKCSELEQRKQEEMDTFLKALKENVDKLEDVTSTTIPEPHRLFPEFDTLIQKLFNNFQHLKSQMLQEAEKQANILKEKNVEIKKLLHSSDILNQELQQKNQIIREYENEIKEFEKNNELLIMELESYKTNNALETISETDEDKIILLEEQLEQATKRVKDLEKCLEKIDSMDQTDLTLNKLDMLEMEVEEKEYQYLEILNKYDKLQIDYDFLKKDLESVKEDLKFANAEYLSLKSLSEIDENNVEQVKHSQTFNEQLKNEIASYKEKFEDLTKQNYKLETVNEETCAQIENLRSEINIYKEKHLLSESKVSVLEDEIRTLTEKLKSVKMTETSLKLQYDTLSKDFSNLSVTKTVLEEKLDTTKRDLETVKNEFLHLQAQHDNLKLEHEDFKKIIADQQNKCMDLKNELEHTQKSLEKNVTEKARLECLTNENDGLKVELERLQNVLKHKNDDLFAENNKMRNEMTEMSKLLDEYKGKFEELTEENKALKHQLETENLRQEKLRQEYETLKNEKSVAFSSEEDMKNKLSDLTVENNRLTNELQKLIPLEAELQRVLENSNQMQHSIEQVSKSRDEMYKALKEKHEENITYHNEIQRLTEMVKNELEKSKNLEMQLNDLRKAQDNKEEIEKLSDENNFLKEKCEILTQNLLKEQQKCEQLLVDKSKPTEEEISLKKKLDRLQEHLLELEERHTQELVLAEQQNSQLQAKINEIEEREKNSSTMYTSVNIRANQQVESLQNLLKVVSGERDSLRKQLSDAEDNINKQTAALTNLQLVLEQFRKEREKEVFKETERLRRQINSEKQVQENLKKEISSLKSQLEEAKQGLLAATRLSDQLEQSKQHSSTLKEEVSQLKSQLVSKEQELNSIKSQTTGKVDKTLIKNLVMGFITTNNTKFNQDQKQILKIIATVLDFSQEDHEKLNLNKDSQGSWLSSLLGPHGNNHNIPQESLSKAFIQFLEKESRPKEIPSLLNISPDQSKAGSSRSSTPKQNMPANLSEILLPTFADFGQNRNSSSILKDVLKDNS